MTTRFLAESYRNLGIMYQAGLGTDKNLRQARSMYRKAIEFGSTSAKRNLDRSYTSDSSVVAVVLLFPEYR